MRWLGVTRGWGLALGALLAVPRPAAAAWSASAGFPWTYSLTGSETASDVAVDCIGGIWEVGNAVLPVTGRDVLLTLWSRTRLGVPLTATTYDRNGGDEGDPRVGTRPYNYGGGLGVLPLTVVAFTSGDTGTGTTDLSFGFIKSVFLAKSFTYVDLWGGDEAAAAVDLDRVDDPHAAGAVMANGVAQMLYVRLPTSAKTFGSTGSVPAPVTTINYECATDYAGPATPVVGRAVAVDGVGGAWVVGVESGDLVLYHESNTSYKDSFGHNTVPPDGAFGSPRQLVTPENDDPRRALLDPSGNLWVAGAIDTDAAIWKFDPAGNLAAGFPRRYPQGAPSSFTGLAGDSAGNMFAAGTMGNVVAPGVIAGALVFQPLDPNGNPTGGALSAGAAPDVLTCAGVAYDATNAVAWVAATRSATGGSAWTGQVQSLYRFEFAPDPVPLPPGRLVLVAPGGAVLNLAHGDRMTIGVRAPASGHLVVQVLTSRGEVVREWNDEADGLNVNAFTWDGRNASGQLVAAGAYPVRAAAPGFKAFKTLVVVRRP